MPARTRPARRAAVLAAAAVLLAACCDDVPATPDTAMVGMGEFYFEPAEITVAANGTLEVDNTGETIHDLDVLGVAAATPVLAVGETYTLSLDGLEAGRYMVVCTLPGHRAGGMQGWLTVTP